MAALHDRPRSGRPRDVDELEIVTTTLSNAGRARAVGVTHWSARLLVGELGVSFASITVDSYVGI